MRSIHPRPNVLHCGRCGQPLRGRHECPSAPPPPADVSMPRQCPRCRGWYSGEACVCVLMARARGEVP